MPEAAPLCCLEVEEVRKAPLGRAASVQPAQGAASDAGAALPNAQQLRSVLVARPNCCVLCTARDSPRLSLTEGKSHRRVVHLLAKVAKVVAEVPKVGRSAGTYAGVLVGAAASGAADTAGVGVAAGVVAAGSFRGLHANRSLSFSISWYPLFGG